MEKSSNKNVLILGCGWLGKLVGTDLIQHGYHVFGTYRNDASKTQLLQLQIDPIYLDLSSISHFSINSTGNIDVVLIMFPPRSSSNYDTILMELVRKFDDKTTFLFTSSIGVYPKSHGIFNENSQLIQEDESILVGAEINLRRLLKNRLTTLRLGGLIGPDRHPIFNLQGKVLEEDGFTPINLIHACDVSEAIKVLVEAKSCGKIYNLVYPDHQLKNNYYSSIAKKLSLPPPMFGSTPSIHREVAGNCIESETLFKYSFPVT